MYNIILNYINEGPVILKYRDREKRNKIFSKLKNALNAKDSIDGNINSFNNVLKKQILLEELKAKGI